MTLFQEKYRVIAVESQRLIIRGVLSGEVLFINAGSETVLSPEDFPVGKLIALTDPSTLPS
jgi:hypothetical protein